jgi:cation diffusion facilitator family transporter
VAVVEACCDPLEVRQEQRRVLVVVLWINAAMFLAEAVAGVLSHSTTLLADSADMLGDAVVYGFSLYVVDREVRWKARAALLKGVLMGAVCLGVLAQVVVKLATDLAPQPETMGVVGGVALGANVACLVLLSRRKGDDINMQSAWICSRNDVIGNAGVLLAAAAVALTGSPWPDLVVGVAIAAIFANSSVRILRAAVRTARAARAADTVLPSRG